MRLTSRSFSRIAHRMTAVLVVAGVCVALGVFVYSASPTSTWKMPAGKDFPLIGGNWFNQRYSTLDKINASNVQKLGGAWLARLEDGQESFMSATPVVVDGVMYVGTGLQTVLAVDAKTGQIKWRHRPKAPDYGLRNAALMKGVVVAEGKVFFGLRDNRLVALDQNTGQLLWETKLTDHPRATTSAAPTYYDGLVYIGTAGADGGARGQIGAYDAKTGKEIWKFYTTPGPGEWASETWEGDAYRFGGGTVWTIPAIDPDLGMIYIGTGNAAPNYDGSRRGGDNLFTASIVALDLKTGAYKWHFQEVHHDLWDYDAASAPLLADLTYQGQARKILMHAGKTGFLYILDRTNGKPLIGIEERPVPQEPRMKTAKTQPFPIGDAFVPQCAEPTPGFFTGCIFVAYYDMPVVVQPGILGGNSFSASTFSPKTNLIYIPATVLNSALEARLVTLNEQKGAFDLVKGRGSSRPAGVSRSGTLTAMDPTTNKIVWQKKTTYPMGGGNGVLSTAGGLLFYGESDGNVVAADIRNGNVLWKFQTGAGADTPAVMYEVDGEQYLAILSGGLGFNMSAKGDFLWGFKLGGTVPQAPAPPAPPVVQPTNAFP